MRVYVLKCLYGNEVSITSGCILGYIGSRFFWVSVQITPPIGYYTRITFSEVVLIYGSSQSCVFLPHHYLSQFVSPILLDELPVCGLY